MNKNLARWIPLIAVLGSLVFLAWISNSLFTGADQSASWSDLKSAVRDGEVSEVIFDSGVVRARRAGGDGPRQWLQAVQVSSDEEFVQLLEEKNVPYRAVQQRGCNAGVTAMFLMPLLILGGIWLLFMRREGRGGVAAFSRSAAKMVPEEGTGVTFEDVAGVDEAADELMEIVAFLKTPERFTALGGRPPKGVLLVGPPGTGKTLLARAVAGEAGVPFMSVSGSTFVEMFVGVGAARVRDLFKTAVEHAPCIVFIDELDAVGKARGLGGPGGNEEREQTLNQLLVEMDGFDNRKGIILMAASNRPETLDPALLRPGRFDRQVLVDRPDMKGRLEILEVHARKLKLADTVSLKEIAQLTPGFAGADLANILNEAALLAARREASAVEGGDIQEAIEREVAGLEKKTRRMSEEDKRITAYHEVGHAICAAASPNADPVQKISIIPRGIAALGYTLQRPQDDKFHQTKSDLLNRLTILYGGRAAEEIIFGDVTGGAASDIRRATDIARKMVTELGMSKSIGAVYYPGDGGTNAFGIPNGMMGSSLQASPATAEAIENEVRDVLTMCHERAVQILLDNRLLLEEMTAALLEHEVLDGERMNSFLSQAKQASSLEDRPTADWLARFEDDETAVPAR